MACLRINYHAKDRLPLLTGPVRASYERLRVRYPDAAVLIRSGWVKGPHIDLSVGSDQLVDLTPEKALIEGWIAANPSVSYYTEAEHLAHSHKLAALEGVTEELSPLRADNSVEIEQYRAPRLVDGHDALQPTYAMFFNRVAPILLDLAELKQHSTSAVTMVLAAMLAHTADQLEPHGIARGYLSLQAHADFFFANYDKSGAVRSRFDHAAEASKHLLVQVMAGRPGDAVEPRFAPVADQIFAAWKAVMLATKSDIAAAIARDDSWFYYNPGAFRGNVAEDHHRDAFAKAGIEEREIKAGETLNTIFDQGAMDHEFFRSREFQTYRVLINCFYSILPVISVSPVERFGLCHLVTLAHLRSVGDHVMAAA